MTAFHLPTHHAVNRYFREQAANLAAIISRTTDQQHSTWGMQYQKGRMTSAAMEALAADYERLLSESHAFGVGSSHKKASKALPQRERREVSAFFMEPLAIGQGWIEEGWQPYVEQALYLRSISVEFRRKKAFLGIGASGVILTKHLLSRIYERTEVDHTEFASLVHEHIGELLSGLALADAANLWILDGTSCVTAVPFANGLLIVNMRMILGREDEGDFGWRAELPHSNVQTPYMNAKMIVNRDPLGSAGAYLPTMGMCGTTYLNITDLRDEQADYFYAFEALVEEVGVDLLQALASAIFRPHMVHEKREEYYLKGERFPRLAKVNALLRSGWLRADPQSVAILLPFDTKVTHD